VIIHEGDRPMIRGRLRRLGRAGEAEQADEYIEIDPSELSGLFAAPGWLRDAGFTAWLLVGVVVLIAGAIWLATLTEVILIPVIVAGVIAAVAGQLVDLLKHYGLPRGLGALLVLLLIIGAGILAAYLVLRGIGTETSAISDQLRHGADRIQGWVRDLGVSDGKARAANQDLSSGTTDSFKALTHGLVGGIEKLASLAFFLAMTILSLFFLLKDGPAIRSWTERHVGLPTEVAHTISGRTLESLRGYFLGVTIVAVFSAVLVGGAALVLGIPLAGTIAVVTFIGGYVPYLGAWTAGAFSVLIALGGSGPEAAGAMVIVQLLSNGPLQQIVQPVAYGAALGLHPLAVLILTIAGGALFGTVGLILAAPLASAFVRVSADLSRARAEAEAAPAAA
jgi:putative heme transporter